MAVNPANNQIQGVYGLSYDANGNTISQYNNGMTYGLTYDAQNRMTAETWDGTAYASYAYDAQNRRIWNWPGSTDSNGNTTNYTVNFYSASGQKLGAYVVATVFVSNAQTGWQIVPSLNVTLSSGDQYFGGRRLAAIDQLGSVATSASYPQTPGTFYPWGEARGSMNPQDSWSYATYWRDSISGLDYANNRYYSNAYGRFMTPDPYEAGGRGAGNPGDPGSWNRYAYTRGDPVNRFDPNGTDDSGDGGDGGDDGSGTDSFACDTSWESDASLVGTPCGVQVPSPWGGMVYINITAIVAAALAQVGASAATPTPDCNAITAAVGFPGLTYTIALEIWNDGNLSTYSTDSAAATIAALAAVTWQGESSFSLNPTNNGNYSKTGALLSVDYGPFQINQHFNPNPNQSVWGTNGAGAVFNGNPDANIGFGISILQGLYTSFGNNAAGRYVGSLGSVNGQPTLGQKRENTWNSWSSKLIGLFSNTNCFPHQ